MANDMNKIILIGRLTKNPELKYTSGGTSVCGFSIANNKTFTKDGEKKEQVSFFNCVAWAKTGEVIAEYCKKGNRVAIDGRLQQRSWENSEGKKIYAVEIVVDNIQFLQQKEERAENQHREVSSAPPQTENSPFSDDDIPF